ncbi:MAG: ParB/RepB/Spo0J family partition protein [Patescibacteria group bacterium]|nr:ParB/RepB/Spo0J family partition protein [Patescibacteria group bacterium]
MIGDGLNSLIPKKDENNGGKQNLRQTAPVLKPQIQTPIRDIPEIVSESVPAINQKEEYQHHFSSRPNIPAYKKHFLNDAIFHIEVEKIKPNPYQPRKDFNEEDMKDLASSIREFGILQPLVVTKIEKEIDMGTEVEYQLIAGERRLKAAKLIGLERVPVIVRQTKNKEENFELAIIENLQRSDLNPIETARAYARLQDEFGLTQREIAQRLSKSREVISNTLRLLDLPVEIQDAVSKKQINESQARLLLSITNSAAQKQLYNDILANNLSVRQVRHRVRKIQDSNIAGKSLDESANEYELKDIEEKLKEFFGTQVKIHKKGDGGEIVISFYSPEEVYEFISKINPIEEI